MTISLTIPLDKIMGNGYRLAKRFDPEQVSRVKTDLFKAFDSQGNLARALRSMGIVTAERPGPKIDHLAHYSELLLCAPPDVQLQSVPYPGSKIELAVVFSPLTPFAGSHRENTPQLQIRASLIGARGGSLTPLIGNAEFQADAAAMATFATETGQALLDGAEPYLVQRSTSNFAFHFSSDPGSTIETILANNRKKPDCNFIFYPLDASGSKKSLSLAQAIVQATWQIH
jgi:hypothetical protein